MPPRLLWGLGWLLVVITASVIALQARRTSKPESRLHREFRLGCIWIPCGTALGVGLGCLACLSGNLRFDDPEGVTAAIFFGSLVGGMTCFAFWASGLIIWAFAGPTKPHGDESAKKPPLKNYEGVEDREIDGHPN